MAKRKTCGDVLEKKMLKDDLIALCNLMTKSNGVGGTGLPDIQ